MFKPKLRPVQDQMTALRRASLGLLAAFARRACPALKFNRSMVSASVLAVLLVEGSISSVVADEIHDLNDGAVSYEATDGVRDIFIWDMRKGATNGKQDIIAINGFDRSEDVLVFKAPATLVYANPFAPFILSPDSVLTGNVDSLVDTYYGEETIEYEEDYYYSEGSYRLLENSLQRHNGAFGSFGEFEVEYRDVPGAGAFSDIFQINGLQYVGVTGVQELLVMGDGGILPLAIDVASQTSPFLFYNGVEIIGLATNEAPIANAGEDQSIRAGDTVMLNGSASYDDNTASTALQYSWSFFSYPGTTAPTLTDANTDSPSFVADVAGTYELSLVVTDEDGLFSEPAFVSISSNNLAPTAVATVDFELAVVGTTSYFDGSGSSDPEMDEITYFWEITAAPLGSTAVLVDAETATPSLTTDVEGTYEVTLTVSDDLGPGVPASVEFVATTPQNFAEIKILEASDLIQALLPVQVTSKGNQTALGKFLKNATKDLQKGNVSKAIDDLNKALERTDGCALRGSPDGNGKGMDWVIDCDAQYDIYNALIVAIELLDSVE